MKNSNLLRIIKNMIICSFEFRFFYQHDNVLDFEQVKRKISDVAEVIACDNKNIIFKIDGGIVHGGIFPSEMLFVIDLMDSKTILCDISLPNLKKVSYVLMYIVMALLLVSMGLKGDFSKIMIFVFLHYTIHVAFYSTVPLRIVKTKFFIKRILAR